MEKSTNRRFAGFAAALCAVGSGVTQAAEPIHFKLDEYGWQYEQTRDHCIAMGEFTDGNKWAHLELRKFTPSDKLQAVVIAQGVSMSSGQIEARLTSSEEPSDIKTMVRIELPGDRHGAIFSLSLNQSKDLTEKEVKETLKSQPKAERDAARFARLASIDGLHLDGLASDPVVFETGAWTTPMAAFDACTDKLLVNWGLDPAVQHNLSRELDMTNPEQIAIYLGSMVPIDPRNPYTSAIIGFRLIVDEKAKVTDCFVFSPSIPAFAKKSCAALKQRAHFKPALDSNGTPVASYYMNTIVFL